MGKDLIKEKSFAFAVRIIKLTEWLQQEKKQYVLGKQLLRSGTAIGALVSEAVFAQSKADFVSKMSIALKEANETRYWLELLFASEIIKEAVFENFLKDITEIIALLASTVKTAKNKMYE